MADLEEREITWGELGVGHVMLGPDGSRWRVVETAIPQQFEYGHSNWLRIADGNGEVFSVPPRPLLKNVTVLIDPDAPPVERSWPSGAKEVAMLMEELGATEIGTQDLATGEIWCPSYTEVIGRQASLDHLRIAHGIDVVNLDTPEQIALAHGQAHDPHKPIGKGGFTHRHMPEDLGFPVK